MCDDATSQLDEVQLHMTKFSKDCTSSITQLWLMYMTIVMILKRFIHAECVGLWEEHVAAVDKTPYIGLPSSSWSFQICVVPPTLSASNE